MKTILPKKMKFCILCSVLLLFSKSTMAQASLRDILLSQLSTKHSASLSEWLPDHRKLQ